MRHIDSPRLLISAILNTAELVEGLLQICFNVVDVFDADAQTDEIFGYFGGNLFFICELLMSCHGGSNNQLPLAFVLE